MAVRFSARFVSIALIAALLLPGLFVFSERTNPVKASSVKMIAPPSAPPAPYAFPGVQSVSLANASASIISTASSAAMSAFGLFATASSVIETLTTAEEEQTEVQPVTSFSQPAGVVDFDFDGDGEADVGRWNATASDFRVKNSSNDTISSYSLGSSSAKAAPADFDRDGKVDVAVFDAGTWTIKQSSDGQTSTTSFGQSGDIPVPADYDGDGTADLAVFRPSNSTWYVKQSSNGQTVSTQFGTAGDIPVSGNYDGDSKADIAIFRPSTGYWWIMGSTAGTMSMQFGVATDIPVPADYDGDGKTDPAVFRASTGTWYNMKSGDNYASYDVVGWGNYADQPVPADYDGDGKADHAIWRPSTGVWHIKESGTPAITTHGLGVVGDVALPSAFLKQVGAGITPYQLAKERLKPRNETGGTNLYSQNFGWGTSLVSLPGRAGLDMGFGMSYNSLVWTKESNNIVFDTNGDNVSPGFRFGFATIEPAYFVPGGIESDDYWVYVMVTPSGGRIEFKQVGVTEFFETTDSSYLSLNAKAAPDPNAPIENIRLMLRGTDGSQMLFVWSGGAFRCEQIKDRNGNFISIEHDEYGLLRKVTDTLGREVNVNYDTEFFPTTITQTWKADNGLGSPTTHTWATFSYAAKEVAASFNSSLNVVGPPNGWFLKVLDKVTYADNSFTKFHYNGFVQVSKVENFAADNSLLNHVATDLDSPGTNLTDVPRFSQTRSKVQNFNNNNETVVTNSFSPGHTPTDIDGNTVNATLIQVALQNHPNGNVTNTFVGSSGWMEGLPILVNDYGDGDLYTPKRSSWTKWTQDDPNSAVTQNPRVTETKIGDGVNLKRSTIDYLLYPSTTVSKFGLVSAVNVYDTDQSTVLKRVETDYNLAAAYLDRRIIGVPSETRVFGVPALAGPLELVSRMTYGFDEGNFTQEPNQIITPIRHDATSYGSAFIVGRGLLTSTTRHDVTGQTAAVTSRVVYDIAGSVVAQFDPLNRKVAIDYTDVFNDNQNRNAFAYPTTVTDPAGNSSTVKYRHDIGANVRAQSPAPVGNTQGKITEREYDSIGRLSKDKIVNHGGAYTRYEYPANGIQSKVFSTIIDTNANGADAADEVLSESWSDGAGRIRFSRVPHTFSGNSTATWAGTITEYDILGRVTRATVPTEVNSNWEATGDDLTRGFLWTHQKYDWMGRVVRKINTDGIDSPALNDSDVLISYEGCGCAGGLVVTVEGELVPRDDQPTLNGRRKQKVYSDILGRDIKTEIYDWNGGVYKTNVTTFNGRDQALKVREHEGYWNNPRYQTTSFSYDGHGRLKSQHKPQQDPGTSTQYTYNADDRPATVTDARGAVTEYTYNNRGLVTESVYTEPTQSPESVVPIEPCSASDPDCEYPYPQPTPPTPSPTPTPVPTPTPAPTPQVITVTFGYDAVGNRTSMTDSQGSTAYVYDELSRMTSETRQFADALTHAPLPNNSFKLTYTYHLAGALKSLTDPYNDVINYANEKTGRLDAVTGSTFGGVTNYASNPGYRAWGGLKGLSYGNGVQMNMTFDNRLLPDYFELKKDTTDIMKKNYDYNQDGSLKYLQDVLNNKFDRLNIYDHVGRIKEGKSGAEARGQTVDPGNMSTDLPYRQSYQFNEYSNMTARNNLHWGVENWYGQSNNLAYTYYNNRIVNYGWQYDKDGRVIQTAHPDEYGSNTYDARGLLAKQLITGQSEIDRFYNGDGREVKRKKRVYVEDPEATQPPYGSWVADNTIYYIRSSVLGGAVVSETYPLGQKQKTFVMAAGAKIATQSAYLWSGATNQSVSWEHTDASGMSYRSTISNGTAITAEGQYEGAPAEFDPMGGNVGISTPYVEDPIQTPPPEPDFPYLQSYQESAGYLNGQRVTCSLDGFAIGCSQAMSMLDTGSAAQCPNNYCGPQVFSVNGRNVLSSPFMAYANGTSGYNVPIWDRNSSMMEGQRTYYRSEIIGWRFQQVSTAMNLGFPRSEWAPQRQTSGFSQDRALINTDVPMPSMEVFREGLLQILDKESGKCRDFLDKVRANLKIKDTVEDLFDKLISKGGEVEMDTRIARAHGINYWGKGGKNVGLGPVTDRWERYITKAIHELFHRAGKDHRQFARAGFNALSEQGQRDKPLPNEPRPGGDMDDTYSGYFTRLMNEFCPPF